MSDLTMLQNMLLKKQQKTEDAVRNAIKRTSELGLEGNYPEAYTLPVQESEGKISGGIKTDAAKDIFQEFGTGIVGMGSPHTADWIEKFGWQYDVNQHGEKGWRYPKKDGTYGWTRGQVAKKKFYYSTQNMANNFIEILKDELEK